MNFEFPQNLINEATDHWLAVRKTKTKPEQLESMIDFVSNKSLPEVRTVTNKLLGTALYKEVSSEPRAKREPKANAALRSIIRAHQKAGLSKAKETALIHSLSGITAKLESGQSLGTLKTEDIVQMVVAQIEG